MAIGINLGDDEDRARRYAEDLEWEIGARRAEVDDLNRAFKLTELALQCVLNIGEGIVLDGYKITKASGQHLIPEHRWFYMSRHVDGIRAYAIDGRADLRHGDRFWRKPSGIRSRRV